MQALSIKNPWAWLIIRPDITDPMQRQEAALAGTIKGVENRTWPTKLRGQFLIHAGKTFDLEGYEWVKEAFPEIIMPEPKEFDCGGFVGQATLADCVMDSPKLWFFGPYGFLLQDAEPLPFVPWKGRLGFFNVTRNWQQGQHE